MSFIPQGADWLQINKLLCPGGWVGATLRAPHQLAAVNRGGAIRKTPIQKREWSQAGVVHVSTALVLCRAAVRTVCSRDGGIAYPHYLEPWGHEVSGQPCLCVGEDVKASNEHRT